MRRITTFRSTTDRIYRGCPVRLYYNIIYNIILYHIKLYYIILYYILYHIILYYIIYYIITLWTGDADLRLYITTVQDG